MDIMKWIFPLYGIVTTAFSLYVFGIGLWGLVKKRPLVFAARQLMWFLLAMYILLTIQSFLPLFESWGREDTLLVLLPFIQVAILMLLIFVSQIWLGRNCPVRRLSRTAQRSGPGSAHARESR